MSGDPTYGGRGLPFVLQLWFDEMMSAANTSFGLFPALTRGATEAIAAHASEELKSRFLPLMIAGEWTGAMALTESSAGTDLALLKTRAEPNSDGITPSPGLKSLSRRATMISRATSYTLYSLAFRNLRRESKALAFSPFPSICPMNVAT